MPRTKSVRDKDIDKSNIIVHKRTSKPNSLYQEEAPVAKQAKRTTSNPKKRVRDKEDSDTLEEENTATKQLKPTILSEEEIDESTTTKDTNDEDSSIDLFLDNEFDEENEEDSLTYSPVAAANQQGVFSPEGDYTPFANLQTPGVQALFHEALQDTVIGFYEPFNYGNLIEGNYLDFEEEDLAPMTLAQLLENFNLFILQNSPEVLPYILENLEALLPDNTDFVIPAIAALGMFMMAPENMIDASTSHIVI